MSEKEDFRKDCVLPENLIPILKNRGLVIDDEQKTIDYLTNIGYFRLSAYLRPLYKDSKSREHEFKSGANFSQAMNMYRFDRNLRLLIFNEIEKIEVAIRSALSNTMSDAFEDVFWIVNPENYINNTSDSKYDFVNTKRHIDDAVKNSKEEFIKHFKKTYKEQYPPAWMVVEVLSLGTLCSIFHTIKELSYKKRIAKHFGLPVPVLSSWIEIISSLRNMCCHHARLWNREISITPKLPLKRLPYPWITTESPDEKHIYIRLCITKYLLDRVSPANNFTHRMKLLLDKFDTVDIAAMGFPVGTDWKTEPLWANEKSESNPIYIK